MRAPTTTGADRAAFAVATPFEELAASAHYEIRLDACSEFEWIVVRTRNSTYELIVLSGDTGEVMVRGGEFFNAFTPATVAGSILGGSAVKRRTICVGYPLELRLHGKPLVTSRVRHLACDQRLSSADTSTPPDVRVPAV